MNKEEKQKILDEMEKLSIVTVEGIAGVLVHRSSVLKILDAMQEESKPIRLLVPRECKACGYSNPHWVNKDPEKIKNQIAKQKIEEYIDCDEGLSPSDWQLLGKILSWLDNK